IASVVFANFLLAALIIPITGVPSGTVGDWTLVAYMGTLQLGFAFYLISRGMRHITALEVSLIMLIEPVLSPMLVWWLHGEEPSTFSLLGGTVIIIATAIRTVGALRSVE
ncbi:MAG: EamA family transporter, partial [Pseudomonadota bacterium]